MITISKLVLSNFRNFKNKTLEFSDNLTLLHGRNGAGKTSILEALTIFGRSSSLRGADFEQMINQGQKNFICYLELQNHEFIDNMKISYNLVSKKKSQEVNCEVINNKRQSDIKKYLINFISLTPKLEQLFISPKSSRRDYLDKIVLDIDPNHSSRILNYQKLLKERLLILQKYRNSDSLSSNKWLDITETKIVELGVAIASARNEALDFFNKAIMSFASNFPKPKLIVKGEIESEITTQSAVILEEKYKAKLQENRQLDLENFKTNFGVHRSDFDAIFSNQDNKEISATLCSTGEQKSIMIGITLARAKISMNYKNQPTILIFDEVVAHLDDNKKRDLFTEISQSKIQSFFSATSEDLIPEDVEGVRPLVV